MGFIQIAALLGAVSNPSIAQDKLDFSQDVRPILSEFCFTCHGPDQANRQANLRLDLAEGALGERRGGAVIVPGNLQESELAYRVATEDENDIMPPLEAKNPMSAKQIEILRRWIGEGAAYASHWAFASPSRAKLPEGQGDQAHAVDAFIHMRLKEEGLSPASPASKEALIRRVTLDLTGLPPTLDEIDAFLADQDPRAFERLVDTLLPQPRTAERLALEWLDVARYADTNGYSIDDHREMWAWRDWVIQAFSENKPYDEFLIEQLAGDLLPNATPGQRIATGFLRNAMNTHEGGTIEEEYRVATIVDQIDTVSTAFMGLTMKCAQCHDHKYDPITQREYYQLFDVFNQSSVRGEGAHNGNTAPTLALGKQWGMRPEVAAAYARRQADLTSFLGQLFGEQRRGWEANQASGVVTAGAPVPEQTAHDTFSAARPQWVWAPEVSADDSLRVIHKFELQEIPKVAHLAISCDNSAVVFVNGQRIAKVAPWTKPQNVNIAEILVVGENSLRFDAGNEGGPAGLLIALVDGSNQAIWATSKAWTFTRTVESALGLPRSGQMKELGAYGCAPWGLFGPATPTNEILALGEDERSYGQWRSLLPEFAATLSTPDKTLLNRQIAAVHGEHGLIERALQAQAPSVMVMDTGQPRTTHLLVRGQYDQHGDVVTAGVPQLLSAPDQEPVTDRLGLANWLTDAKHPLTARVTVNRYWQMLIGKGIVGTTEDFGSQGEWPSHPELLDWLAVSFIEHDWDVRWLLRTILLSATYQQSSGFTKELLERDPGNRLLARSSRYRLPAEFLRDSALQVAGLLSRRVGGPSVYPEQPDGLWRQVSHFGHPTFFSAQAFYASVGVDRYRRSMYTFWKRTAPPPGMTVFDAPSRETCMVRRASTNTPLQALTSLNEPQFVDASRALANRILGSRAELDGQIGLGFRLCTGRRPQPAELEILRSAFRRNYAHFLGSPVQARALTHSDSEDAAVLARSAAASMLASTLLNLDETLTRP